jgi:hypothetical protein
MKDTEIEKIRQIVSRNDISGKWKSRNVNNLYWKLPFYSIDANRCCKGKRTVALFFCIKMKEESLWYHGDTEVRWMEWVP